MEVKRIIAVYNKVGDGFIKEINADNLKMSLIQELFIAFDDDPNFYGAYKIEHKQFNELIKYISGLNSYTTDDYDLYLEAFSN